jgi:hypothetical protein
MDWRPAAVAQIAPLSLDASNGGNDAEEETLARGWSHRSLWCRCGRAFQVLINCLEESDALLPGQFPDALAVYMEMVKSRKGDVSNMTLAVLHDIRAATLD